MRAFPHPPMAMWSGIRCELKLTHATTEQADRAAEGPGEVTAAIAVVKAGMPSGSPTRPVEAAEPGMGDAIGAATESATLPQYAPASADTLNTSSHATLPSQNCRDGDRRKRIRVAMSEATATMDSRGSRDHGVSSGADTELTFRRTPYDTPMICISWIIHVS